ncbi:MAG: hypothetical protein LBD88_00630, partial [Candidatus Peribacteria bacterium]|nr:hypothetical protein [Candidatus Peribacteria bacterium]
QLVVGAGYNGKVLKVYKSTDNQNTFEYVSDCSIVNGICSFRTSGFSVFTLFDKNIVSTSSG